MRLFRSIALLTLLSLGGSQLAAMATQSAVKQPRDLVTRAAAKLKNNGALRHLIKKAAIKKAQTKNRQEKSRTDFDRKKMLYNIVFLCLMCNIPSILAQSIVADKTSDSKEIMPANQSLLQSTKQPTIASFVSTFKSDTDTSTWKKISGTLHSLRETFLIQTVKDIDCEKTTKHSSLVRHERPHGFRQECLIDTEGAHCWLVNPEDTMVVADRSFKLDFNRACNLPPAPRETLGENKIIKELLDATISFKINQYSAPQTYNAIQKLSSHVNAHPNQALLKLDYNNAGWNHETHELVIGKDIIRNFLKNDHEVIFMLGHEIAHGTQSIYSLFGYDHAAHVPYRLHEVAYKEIADQVVSRIKSIEKLIPFAELTIATIIPIALTFLFRNKLRSFKSRALFYLGCAATLISFFEIIKSKGGFDFTNQNPILIDYVKFNHPSCRQSNNEIHADLVSLAISENQYKYAFDDHLKSIPVKDNHPANRFRCAYIQEFIEKYQKLLEGFNADQQALEAQALENHSPQRVIKTMLFGSCVMLMLILFDTLR